MNFYKKIETLIINTPCKQLDTIGRPDIQIKLECNQFADSFKARGIISFLKNIPYPKGFITYTTGNHGIAIAAIAKQLGLQAIIISTRKLNDYKRAIIESYGATIMLIDFYNIDQATTYAKQIAKDKGFTFIPLFDNEELLNGYSQIAKEICQDFPDDLTMFFPVGSGSLILANSKTAKLINPNNKIIAVEPKLFQRLNKLKNQNNSSLSIADSLAIDKIPACNQELKNHIDDIMEIEEKEIVEAMKIIYAQFNIPTEAGGAIALAAALKTNTDSRRKIAVITGKNISKEKFNSIIGIT